MLVFHVVRLPCSDSDMIQRLINCGIIIIIIIIIIAVAGVLYMKNMVMQYWEENDEAKPTDPPVFIIHENDKQVIRDHLVEAVIAASSPIRFTFYCSFDTSYSPVPFNRQYLSYDDCLEDNREDYQNCSVLYCVPQLANSAVHPLGVGK